MSVRTRYYRDKQNGKFLGVLAGVADYIGWDPLWVRVIFVVGTLSGMGFLPLIYFAMAWFASDKPAELRAAAEEETPDDRKFYARMRVAPQRSIRDTRAMYRDVDRRLQDIEAYVTSSNSRLASEIDQLR